MEWVSHNTRNDREAGGRFLPIRSIESLYVLFEETMKKKRDQRAPDECVSYGDRRVRKGGIIKIASANWQSDFLLPFINHTLGVRIEDYWCESITIYYPTYPDGKLILEIFNNGRVQKYPAYDEAIESVSI